MAGRAKNASRNILFGLILKIYQIAAPFLTRTLMIKYMSIEYTGLSGLFTSVLQMLNLAELGVGSAMIYSMYKPIAEHNTNKIRILMNTYKKYYRIVGAAIAIIGLALTPFIPYLIKGNPVPELNIYTLYLISLAATVMSYWMFAYKSSILQAHQRNDIISKINIISSTILYLIQISSIIAFKNYYLFITATLVSQIITNIIVAIVSRKLYPEYSPKGELSEKEKIEINGRIKDLFTAKIGGTIVNSADTLVISAFLGLTTLTIYQNYFYIITALNGLLSVFYSATIAGIGNSIITESKEKNYKDLQKFTFIIMWIVGFCSICLLCLYQPFIKLWVGEDLMLGVPAVICLSVYFFIYHFNQLMCTYKDAAGIWHKDRFRPLATALTNFVLNIISVQFIGIYGVILSTVISYMFIGSPWLIKNLFSTVLNISGMPKYIKDILGYTLTTAFLAAISFFITQIFHSNAIIQLIAGGIACAIVINVGYLVLYRKTDNFRQSKQLILKIIKGKA